MSERVVGAETEFAVMVPGRRGARDGPTSACSGLLSSGLLSLARERLPHLPGIGGLFLANGGRFYQDVGSHPEMSTPEVPLPGECVRYILAGEAIVRDLARELSDRWGTDVHVFTVNVDYAQPNVTWAFHESYQHRTNPAALPRQLLAHLVTRLYLGAGGLNPACLGIEFSLCPRAHTFVSDASHATTHDRGIFNTRDESLSVGSDRRLHVICCDCLRSHIALWLRLATTQLVVAMAEGGLEPGRDVQLRNPVKALHAIAVDPTLRTPVLLADGRKLSPIQIQRHYLERAEANLSHKCLPSWAPEACRRWRAMLDRVERGPCAVERTLDWAIKRSLFLDHIRERGVDPDTLVHWNHVLERLERARRQARLRSRLSADKILARRGSLKHEADECRQYLKARGLDLKRVGEILALRSQLAEIDMRFGQVAPDGIFAALEPALDHRIPEVPDVDCIEEAMTSPPPSGRARLRGEAIRRLAGRPGCSAGWTFVRDDRGRTLKLPEPSGRNARWVEAPDAEGSAE